MIELSRIEKVYLFHGVTDFRKGIAGLYQLVEDSFEKENYRNSLFLFCNKKKDSIKILEILDTSVWLYQKRLIKGKFPYPEVEQEAVITPDELKIIISGLDFIQALEKLENRSS